MVPVSICFFSHPILASFCSYLPGRITNFDNDGDTRVRPHRGDEGVLRVTANVSEIKTSGIRFGFSSRDLARKASKLPAGRIGVLCGRR